MKNAIDPDHGICNKTPGIYDPGGCHKCDGFEFREAAIAVKYCKTLRAKCQEQV